MVLVPTCLFLVSYKLNWIFTVATQVRLPSMDGKVALVPWADMLNHSSEVSSYIFLKKLTSGSWILGLPVYQILSFPDLPTCSCSYLLHVYICSLV